MARQKINAAPRAHNKIWRRAIIKTRMASRSRRIKKKTHGAWRMARKIIGEKHHICSVFAMLKISGAWNKRAQINFGILLRKRVKRGAARHLSSMARENESSGGAKASEEETIKQKEKTHRNRSMRGKKRNIRKKYQQRAIRKWKWNNNEIAYIM